MSRAPRSYETNDHAHSMRTSRRLRKPMSKSKCRSSQASQARRSRELDLPEVGDGRRAADRGERSLVLVTKRQRGLAAVSRGARCGPRAAPPASPPARRREPARRPERATPDPRRRTPRGVPAIERSGPHGDPSRSDRGARRGRVRTPSPATPAAQSTVRVAMRSLPMPTPSASIAGHLLPGADVDPEAHELLARLLAERRGVQAARRDRSPRGGSPAPARG